MRTQINAITIAAKDLVLLKNFYVKVFGWEIHAENQDILMFRLKNGLVLSIYEQDAHASYIGATGLEVGPRPKSYLTINTNSLKETDEVFMELDRKGAHIIKKPAQVFWGGYAGIVADPEGNYWEICYNPLE